MQYMPGTWRAYSTKVYGKVLEKTPEREWYVTVKMIEMWLSQGHDADNIARIWNQGNAGPCVKGTNKYGVAYDSCAYERAVVSIYQEKVLAYR
jgi:hypothetical protein